MERVLAELRRLGKEVQPAKCGFMAQCPAHDDGRGERKSLSIRDGYKGVVLHCFASCTPEAIVGALGLELKDLFPDTGSRNGREIATTYDYTDEQGTVLFQVVRFRPKDFRQRRSDGNGGWIWNLDGVRRVLYRLPQLRAAVAAGKRVFVVEGEKDVLALEGAGYTATCNPGGAGKWRPEYTAELKGADVVIVADADEPGLEHARQLLTALRGTAAKVVVVKPAVGKDVSDHLDAGRTLAELVPLKIESAAPRLTHIRDLLAEPDDVVSWIVDGLLPAGGLSVFGGKPKAGKSTTARAIALRVCRGEPVLGRTTTRGPVIYLGLEDPRRVTKQHLRTLGARADDALYVFTGRRPDEAVLWLDGVLAQVDPVLVVVDTLQHLLGVSDLNDYARVVDALGPVLALVRPRRAHLQLVHHAGKGERSGFDAILGSTAIVGTVDVALLLRRRDDNTRTLATLQRSGEDLPESVVVLDAQQEPRLAGTRADYDAQRAGERVLEWLGKQAEPVSRPEVQAGVEGDGAAVTRALYALVKDGKVRRTGRGVRGDGFLYSCLLPMSQAGMQESKTGQESSNGGPDSCLLWSGVLPSTPDHSRQESDLGPGMQPDIPPPPEGPIEDDEPDPEGLFDPELEDPDQAARDAQRGSA